MSEDSLDFILNFPSIHSVMPCVGYIPLFQHHIYLPLTVFSSYFISEVFLAIAGKTPDPFKDVLGHFSSFLFLPQDMYPTVQKTPSLSWDSGLPNLVSIWALVM